MGFNNLAWMAWTVEGVGGEGLDEVPGEKWYDVWSSRILAL